MRDLIKLLNDLNPADFCELDDGELTRLEALCQKWAILTESERGRRASLPKSEGAANAWKG